MKRNNSVPEEIDRLPDIQMKRRETMGAPSHHLPPALTVNENKQPRHSKQTSSKNLDESFKKYKALDIIKEDKDDD
jgi:hypothetical protein